MTKIWSILLLWEFFWCVCMCLVGYDQNYKISHFILHAIINPTIMLFWYVSIITRQFRVQIIPIIFWFLLIPERFKKWLLIKLTSLKRLKHFKIFSFTSYKCYCIWSIFASTKSFMIIEAREIILCITMAYSNSLF